jgi:hypothetical protein
MANKQANNDINAVIAVKDFNQKIVLKGCKENCMKSMPMAEKL